MINKFVASAITAATLVVGAPLASAAFTQDDVVDSWGLNTPGGGLTEDIGHLNLGGGIATVTQEVDSMSFEPFVGARFTEFGNIFTITFTPESDPGQGDSGPQGILNSYQLELRFSGLTGSVTSFNSGTGALGYEFDAGVGTIGLYEASTPNLLASFQMTDPSGGGLNNFFGAAQSTDGTSTIFGLVLDSVPNLFLFDDGTSMDPLILQSLVYGLVITTNTISAPFINAGACSFDAAATCFQGNVTSEGTFDLLVETVPEPLPITLLGLGMLMLSLVRSRKA